MSHEAFKHIAEDIIQARIPLPYALNSVNCYLLRGTAGWSLVDTGLNTAAARQRWRVIMDGLGIKPDDIETIALTHLHPDHFGMAGWWQGQRAEPIPLYLPEGELPLMRSLYRPGHERVTHEWLLRCGMAEAAAHALEAALQSTRGLTQPHPTEFGLLRAGDAVQLGKRQFRAIHAPGHSDGQLIFYDEADKLMICGDHVLMRITPNIGSWPQSEADPLGRYLASLHALAGLDVELALPGHKRLIRDWGGRIKEIIAHHEQRLLATRQALDDGARTTLEVAGRLFDMGRLTPHEWRFALAESLAHLEYLEAAGDLTREEDAGGGATEWIGA